MTLSLNSWNLVFKGLGCPDTYYKWKRKYSGMEQNDIKKLRELERENAKLKKMYADMALMNEALKDVIEKKL